MATMLKMAASTNKTQMLPREKELELALAWKNDRCFESRDKLLQAYNPLRIAMVHKTAKQNGIVDRERIQDMINEAYVAMNAALDDFDTEKGLGFGTYARHPVQSALHRYVMDNIGHCRMGTNVHDKTVFFKMRTARIELEKQLGRELTAADAPLIAEKLKVPVKAVERMSMRMTAVDISLDTGFTHGDIDDDVEDHSVTSQLHAGDPSPEDSTINNIDGPVIRNLLRRAISALPYRERVVIMSRLASTSEKKISLQMLAQQLRLSKKHVREIEEKAKILLKAELASIGVHSYAEVN